jgi:hypothetical protein
MAIHDQDFYCIHTTDPMTGLTFGKLAAAID